jgi:hypothetical protein
MTLAIKTETFRIKSRVELERISVEFILEITLFLEITNASR